MSSVQEKITIVVPCYNVENFLARCLDSLLAQTYPNLEVIMVEDCSTDGTRDVVRKYEKKYSNLRAIYNQVNGGLGHARNVGIEATDSKYIAFLDSDDWLPENYISEMYEALVTNDADLSVCDVYLRYDDSSKDQRIVSYNGKPDKFGLINTGLAATSSAKLFKTELFNNLKYPEGIVNEDIPVTLALLSNFKVAYTDKTHFSYYQRPGSIQNGKVTVRRLDVFKALALLKKNIGRKVDSKLWQAIVWQQIFAVFIYVFPRAKGVFARRKLIEQFYYAAQDNGIEINSDNPGFIEFLNSGKLNLIYGYRVEKYLSSKKFLQASLAMGVFSFVQKHPVLFRRMYKLLKLLKFAVLHPIQFARRVKNRLARKVTIKNDVTIRDVIKAAKKQHSMSADSPVSVIIPNYNYERFMLQRIYSILNQTWKVGEIIVLDDNSTDGSVKLATHIQSEVTEYVPIRLINNKVNRGTFSQWELGFKRAKLDYIWIAEADDYSDEDFLKHAVAPLDNDDKVVISYVNTGYVNEVGLLLGDVENDIDYQQSGHWSSDFISDGKDEARCYTYLNNTIANVSSVVFRRRKDIQYAELFEEARKYRQAGDWVFYVNYMIYGRIAYTHKILNYYRIHGSNVSSTTKAKDHIGEILDIQKYFIAKLKLENEHRAKMAARIRLLEKAWGL